MDKVCNLVKRMSSRKSVASQGSRMPAKIGIDPMASISKKRFFLLDQISAVVQTYWTLFKLSFKVIIERLNFVPKRQVMCFLLHIFMWVSSNRLRKEGFSTIGNDEKVSTINVNTFSSKFDCCNPPFLNLFPLFCFSVRYSS